MNNYRTIEIDENFVVEVEGFPLETELSDDILRLWEQEKVFKPLVDGEIFSFTRLEEGRLVGQFVPYSYYYVQTRFSGFDLGIQSVGVTGLTYQGSKLLVGRRADWVTLYPHFYELAPAGTISRRSCVRNRIDIQKQVLEELEEEVHVGKVEGIRPRYLLLNEDKPQIELFIEIHLPDDAVARVSEEYPEILWVEKHNVKEFAEKNKDALVPESYHIMLCI